MPAPFPGSMRSKHYVTDTSCGQSMLHLPRCANGKIARLIGRQHELLRLCRAYDSPGGQLALVWGRRRIGKSYTLQAFSQGKPTIFYQATASGIRRVVAFTQAVSRVVGAHYLPPGYSFPSWEAALNFIVERSVQPRLLVVFDEFPYLTESTKGLPSIIQRWWDQRGQRSQVMLVLCGSAQAFMEALDDEAAPLHQRFTSRLRVDPLSYRDVVKFMPDLSHEDHARLRCARWHAVVPREVERGFELRGQHLRAVCRSGELPNRFRRTRSYERRA